MSKTTRKQKSPASGASAANRRKSPPRGSAKSGAARASSFAYQATDTVLKAASDGASGISERVTSLLGEQVGHGAALMSQVASSTRLAADDLSETMPHVAGMVNSAADRLDSFADDVRYKTVDQVVGLAADIARRQPLATFGLAALAGFLVIRALGNTTVAPAEPKIAAKRRRSRNA